MVCLKRTRLICACAFLLITHALEAQLPAGELEKRKEEVRQMELSFSADLNQHGAAFAFRKYASPDAVIKREKDSLIYGPDAIYHFYNQGQQNKAKGYWAADKVEISADGTMASTYGKYRWVITDAAGKETSYHGIFHTVWKKQSDGTWKYVWD
jgi:ketosteroid isomerase-like protein